MPPAWLAGVMYGGIYELDESRCSISVSLSVLLHHHAAPPALLDSRRSYLRVLSINRLNLCKNFSFPHKLFQCRGDVDLPLRLLSGTPKHSKLPSSMNLTWHLTKTCL